MKHLTLFGLVGGTVAGLIVGGVVLPVALGNGNASDGPSEPNGVYSAPPIGDVTVLPPIISTEDLQRYLNPPNSYPDVVATVNGESISGSRLAVLIEGAHQKQKQADNQPAAVRESLVSLPKDDQQLQNLMLDELTREQLLMQEARKHGVEATDADGKAMLDHEKTTAASVKFDDKMASLWQVFMSQGDDVLINEYKRYLTLNNAEAYLASQLSSDDQQKPDVVKAHLRQATDDLRASANIQIFIKQ